MRIAELEGQLVQGSSDGPLLVLMHGIGLGAWIWSRDQRIWAEQHGLSSLALDLPGHGARVGEDPSIGALCQEVQDALRSLDRPLVLIGHSMGGLVAQVLAASMEVESLVVISSAPPKGVLLRPTRVGVRAMLPKLAGLLRGKPLTLSEKAYLACGFDQLGEAAQRQALEMRTPWPNQLTRELAFARPELARDAISAPMLVVHGFRDPIVTLHQSRLLADYYGAVLWRFDDVAHHPMLEPAGERVSHAVAEYVGKPLRRTVREIDAFSPEQGIGKQARDARDPNPARSDSRFGDRRRSK